MLFGSKNSPRWIVGALKIPASDASQDLQPESEPILCCIWPASLDQSGCRKADQKTNQVAPCNPNFDPLPPIVDHCPLLATRINFWERRQGNLLYASFWATPKLTKKASLICFAIANIQHPTFCCQKLFWVVCKCKFSTSALFRWAISSAIKSDLPCWILKFGF